MVPFWFVPRLPGDKVVSQAQKRGKMRERKTRAGNKRQQKAILMRLKGNRTQHKATKGITRQQQATEGNRMGKKTEKAT